ncbi:MULTISPECIES: methyltransferase domain-containing protein [unclassified Novosphingobium]|uniref:RsmB/NOP family class I SAM-dependent RNA methyltransferase n=1 Tax=unclassified Novosphingobium TaxID=2644732 RepID=UPI000ED0E996|nr:MULTISPECIES: methyltransferase domain-containing protein [unclassified Novosphingobium]HCF24906.1 SAM-dependent methyltransferase [Novosphingobium sp.]HQV03188.1 methyltransferase domain-containing protein [Novosphingobium sp.]
MDIPGFPARKGALKMLDAVLNRGETLDMAANGALQGIRSGPDKALARALAGEALRWLIDLDALIDSATRLPLAPDAKARSVLRLMLAGWLRLDTPPHAVIATGLELLSGGPRRLAHGVFSALVRQDAKLPAVPTLPPQVAERWAGRAPAIASGLAVPPPLDLSLRDPAETALWAERLDGTSLAPGHVRLARGTAVENLVGFDAGAWWVQDLAASLPARLLGAGAGRRVLDLCAAPGGKTLQLAAAGWQVTAVERSAKRAERIDQNLARLNLSAEVVIADALQWQPAEPFDAVLLDAPCTATGTARRHPDVLHRIGPRQIAEMAELQAALLARAASWIKPGGQLVYAVCSLEQAEGGAQAQQVSLKPDPIRADELPAGLSPSSEGWLRTDPGMLADAGGLDGFFVARFRA